MDERDPRDPKFIERVRKGVSHFCRKHSQIPEDDLFQSVYEKFLTGRQKSTIDQVCIDVHREQFGRKNSTHHKQLAKFVDWEAVGLENWKPANTVDPIHKIELEKVIALQPERTQKILRLMAAGYNQKEVGDELEIHWSRINQIIFLASAVVNDANADPFISVGNAAKEADVCYVKTCEQIRKGKIPFQLIDGTRHVKRSDVENFKKLRLVYANQWHKHLHEYYEHGPVIAPPKVEYMNHFPLPPIDPPKLIPDHMFPKLPEKPVEAKKPEPTLADKLYARAKQCHADRKFEAASEIFAFLGDNADYFFFKEEA